MTKRFLLAFPLFVLSIAIAGCGGTSKTQLTVFAASSLRTPLTAYGDSFEGAEVRSSFAGSDTLAAQLRQGAPADVFASADTSFPAELFREGLVEKPIVFAANELVIAVPADSDISALADLARPGTRIAIGDPSVPAGSYAREVLRKLAGGEEEGILANVRSEEPEVSSIVAKLDRGAAEAGFVYATDVEAAGGGLRAVGLPAGLRPRVAYAAAVARRSGEPELARRYLDGLLHGEGAADLRRAGFRPPP